MDFKIKNFVAEHAPIAAMAAVLVLLKMIPPTRAVAISIPLKMAWDVIFENDTWLNEEFFDIDGGWAVKIFVAGATIFFLEGRPNID